MATRSTICLVLRKEDIGKELKFDETKLPKDVMYSNEYLQMVGSVKLEKPILQIYHYWDGYPQGVGYTLLEKFNDYDTILNLMLGGDASSINGDVIQQYCAWGGEDWDSVQPYQTDEFTLTEDFIYKFEDGEWWFDGYDCDGWCNLKDYLSNMENESEDDNEDIEVDCDND